MAVGRDLKPRIWLFLNSPHKVANLPKSPPPGSKIFAADGGASRLIELDWPANLIVGDLDSLNRRDLAAVKKAKDFRLLSFPKDKDQTDFELLFGLALESLAEPSQIVVASGLGGSWDMTLGNLLLPFARSFRRLWRRSQIVFLAPKAKIYCLQGPTELAIPKERLFPCCRK